MRLKITCIPNRNLYKNDRVLAQDIDFFEQYEIPYMLSGSVAMSVYAVPRHTKDFDFVIHLKLDDATIMADYFKTGYYCNEEAVKDAILHKSMFNIIDFESGYKADFILLKDQPYRQEEFGRKQLVEFMNLKIWIVSPEDLILSKIIRIQELNSDLQKHDISVLIKNPNLDWDYLKRWISSLKLNTF